jgi:hypothetical protein
LLLWSTRAVAAMGCDGAGNCYVLQAAATGGDGSTWTRACAGFAGACDPTSATARGVTFWVGVGSYGSVTFSAPESGTLVTTIKAATAGRHGPATDWNAACAGQAVFAESTIASGYWAFEGQSRGADWTSGYNLKLWNKTDGSSTGAALAIQGVSNVSLDNIEVEGTNGGYTGSGDDVGIWTYPVVNQLYIGHSYIHDVGVDLIESNECNGAGTNGDGHTFEYDYFSRNHTGDPSQHAQALAECASDLIVRYSMFHNIVSSGVITIPTPGGAVLSNWYIYGNTWFWDASLPSTQGVGDGLVGFFGETFHGVVQIYGNTIANINGPGCAAEGAACNSPALFLCGSSCAYAGCAAGDCGDPTVTLYNNLWWNPNAGGNLLVDSSGAEWTPTADYGEGYCPAGGCTYGGSFSTGGPNDVTATGNPFVKFDGTTSVGVSFELVADTAPGRTLSAASSTPTSCAAGATCENVDPLGVSRGADGVWDRGAFQIAGDGGVAGTAGTGGGGGSTGAQGSRGGAPSGTGGGSGAIRGSGGGNGITSAGGSTTGTGVRSFGTSSGSGAAASRSASFGGRSAAGGGCGCGMAGGPGPWRFAAPLLALLMLGALRRCRACVARCAGVPRA